MQNGIFLISLAASHEDLKPKHWKWTLKKEFEWSDDFELHAK